MASFFEKLKKGMGIEEPIAEPEEEIETEETIIKTKTNKKPRKTKKENKAPEVKTPYKSLRDYTGQVKKLEIQTKMPEEEVKEQAEKEPPKEPKEQTEKKWPSFARPEEGQLAIDVYQTENDLVIQSAIAGVKPENLDISMERDIIYIKGSREKPLEENGDYFIQECFWGPFSREVILPSEVDPQRAVAEMKNNILTIRIPKILREKKRRIIVRG